MPTCSELPFFRVSALNLPSMLRPLARIGPNHPSADQDPVKALGPFPVGRGPENLSTGLPLQV